MRRRLFGHDRYRIMTGLSETRTVVTGVAPQEPVLRIAISVIGRFHMFDLARQMLRLACGSRIAYVHKPLMTLTPREATDPYAFVNWRLLFWNCAICRRALSLYHRRHRSETEAYTAGAFVSCAGKRCSTIWPYISSGFAGNWLGSV